MSKKWGGCNPYLNSYHHTDSLLFQFILSEFLQTLNVVLQIEKSILHLENYAQLKEWLHALSGCDCLGSGRSFPWPQKEGRLIKLKAYIDFLVERWADHSAMKITLALQKHVDHAWYATLDAEDRVRHEAWEDLPCVLEKLQSSSQKIKKEINKLFFFFSMDENVIFFMIRHHADFSGIFGSEFVSKTLQKMYRGGINEAKEFLIDAFTRRNFQEVLPVIYSYFNTHEKAVV